MTQTKIALNKFMVKPLCLYVYATDEHVCRVVLTSSILNTEKIF